MFSDYGYKKCTLCQQVYQRNVEHLCPATAERLGDEVEKWLAEREKNAQGG